MDLRQMGYILMMAESGNMTKAAEQLHVSQSTLSLSYRNLEQELGVTLFKKRGRYLELTTAGQVFCEKAAVVMEKNADLRSAMEQFHQDESMSISFCTEAVDFSEEAVLLFQSFFPEIQISQIRNESGLVPKYLHDNSAQFAITLTAPNSKQYTTQLLLEEPMYALISRRSPLAGRDRLSLSMLQNMPLITQSSRFAINTLIHSFYVKSGLNPGRIIEVGDPETIGLQVGKGSGISFIPESVSRFSSNAALLELNGCTALPLEEPYCQRKVFLLSPKQEKLSRLCSAFQDFLIDFGVFAQAYHCFPDQSAFQGAEGYNLELISYPED